MAIDSFAESLFTSLAIFALRTGLQCDAKCQRNACCDTYCLVYGSSTTQQARVEVRAHEEEDEIIYDQSRQ